MAPSYEAREAPRAALVEGGPGAGWLVGGDVAAQAPQGSGPVLGPAAIRLAEGAWVKPDVLRGVAPVTWEQRGELLFVRFHGKRMARGLHLEDPEAPDDTWVIERSAGGVVYTTTYAAVPWQRGATAMPPPEQACPTGTRMQLLAPGALSPPILRDCRPPETPEWPVSARFATDYPLDVRSGDRVSACVDSQGVVMGAFVHERPVAEGTLVVRGPVDGFGDMTLTLETSTAPPILLAHGTERRPGGASFDWLCAADDRVFCPCGQVEARFELGGDVAEWHGKRGKRELHLDLEDHDPPEMQE